MSDLRQWNKWIQAFVAILLGIVLGVTLMTDNIKEDAHAASANAPVPKSIVYQGKGHVTVTFREKVKYKKTKVKVKDKNGKYHKVTITRKGGDRISFFVGKCKEGQTYRFRINGIKVSGFKRYTSVDGTFRSTNLRRVTVQKVEYDSKTNQVNFQFRDEVEWKSPKVTIQRKSRKYNRKILDKDAMHIEVKVKKLKYGKKYKYKIKGVRVRGTSEYFTVTGYFKALAG